MISTRDSKNEELDNILLENVKEMAEQLKLIYYTDYAEVTYVDIYMPVSWLQGNVTIIDTSGFEDMEQRNVAEKMVCCLPTAFAFVLVVNVSSAGGLLDEKFIRFLSIVKHSMDGMKGVDPEDVIILLNKWDCLSNEDVEQQELIFKHMKTCLRKMWMEIDESCIFRTSARQVFKKKPKYTTDFDMFQITLKEVISRNMNKRIKVHLRFLNTFLDECNKVLSTKLECDNKKAEKNRKLLDKLSKKLETIEKKQEKGLFQILTEILIIFLLKRLLNFINTFTTQNSEQQFLGIRIISQEFRSERYWTLAFKTKRKPGRKNTLKTFYEKQLWLI